MSPANQRRATPTNISANKKLPNHSEIRCDCGKRILIPPEMAGKRVKCPKCKAKYRAPKKLSPGTTEKRKKLDDLEVVEDDGLSITFACDCGKSYAAKPGFAGNMICCSDCKKMLRIPGDQKSAALSSQQVEDSIEISRDDFFAIGSEDDLFDEDLFGNDPLATSPIPVARPVAGASPLDPLSAAGPLDAASSVQSAGKAGESPVVIAEAVEWSPFSPSAYNAICLSEPTWLVAATVVVSLLLTLSLPVLAVLSWSMSREGLRSKSWELARMTITHASIDTSPAGVTPPRYQATVQYTYTVNGEELRHRRISFRDEVTTDRSKAEEIASRYPVGSSHFGRYDPENPNDAVLSPGIGTRQWNAIALTTLCALAPFVLFVQSMVLAWRFQQDSD